jgi:hypothetical protein
MDGKQIILGSVQDQNHKDLMPGTDSRNNLTFESQNIFNLIFKKNQSIEIFTFIEDIKFNLLVNILSLSLILPCQSLPS